MFFKYFRIISIRYMLGPTFVDIDFINFNFVDLLLRIKIHENKTPTCIDILKYIITKIIKTRLLLQQKGIPF